MSEKNESEFENQKDNSSNVTEYEAIMKKTEPIISCEEIKCETRNHNENSISSTNINNFQLISIKSEVIDTEYDSNVSKEVLVSDTVNNNNNKKQEVVENRLVESIDKLKQNIEDTKIEEISSSSSTSSSSSGHSSSVIINTRKRRLLQGVQATCEQISIKRKSETTSNNESLNESPSMLVATTKQATQKYEIFKPTIKMQKKESCNNNNNCPVIASTSNLSVASDNLSESITENTNINESIISKDVVVTPSSLNDDKLEINVTESNLLPIHSANQDENSKHDHEDDDSKISDKGIFQ